MANQRRAMNMRTSSNTCTQTPTYKYLHTRFEVVPHHLDMNSDQLLIQQTNLNGRAALIICHFDSFFFFWTSRPRADGNLSDKGQQKQAASRLTKVGKSKRQAD